MKPSSLSLIVQNRMSVRFSPRRILATIQRSLLQQLPPSLLSLKSLLLPPSLPRRHLCYGLPLRSGKLQFGFVPASFREGGIAKRSVDSSPLCNTPNLPILLPVSTIAAPFQIADFIVCET